MRIKRSNQAVNKLYVVVVEVFRDAIHLNSDHATICNGLINRVYKHALWSKIPQWAQSRVSGYIDAQCQVLYRDHLEWRVCLDGQLIPGDNVPDGRWSEVTDGAYVWRKSPDSRF